MAADTGNGAFPTVEELMTHEVITVGPRDRLREVARLIKEHGVSGFPVVDDGGKVVGVITEGDFLKRYREIEGPTFIEILGGFFPLRSLSAVEEELKQIAAVHVEDIMSKPAITARPDWSVQRVAGLMMKRRVNRLPVVDEEDRVLGIITRGDIITALEGLG